jgi:hypothetical protein
MNLLEHEFATVQTGDRRFHKRSGAAAPSSPGLVTCCGQAGFHSPRRDLLPASNDGKSITHSSNTSILIQLATRALWCDYGCQVVPELARPAALLSYAAMATAASHLMRRPAIRSTAVGT